MPEANLPAIERLQPQFQDGFACIGEIVAEPGLEILDDSGRPYRPATRGHDHFAFV